MDAHLKFETCISEDPQHRVPGGRNPRKPDSGRASKRGRFTRRRMRPRARFRPACGGSRASGQKRRKRMFLQCFAVGRAFLEAGRSGSRFLRNLNRGGSESMRAPNTGASEGFDRHDREWRISQELLQTGTERPSQHPRKASLTP